MFQGYIGEGELVCEVCDHEGLEEYFSDQETDSPCNCAYCHRPINCVLTQDGIKYVYESVREALKNGLNARSDWRWEYGWYKGLGVRDHAEQLLEYNLEKKAKRVVEYYLYHTSNMP